MSQILKVATWRGNPVEILTGWDGMDSQVFVKVALLDARGEWRDDVELVLDAWKDVEERPSELREAAPLAMGVQDKLRTLNIEVSDQLVGEIAAHIVLDARNVIVRYGPDGSRTLLESDIEGYK